MEQSTNSMSGLWNFLGKFQRQEIKGRKICHTQIMPLWHRIILSWRNWVEADTRKAPYFPLIWLKAEHEFIELSLFCFPTMKEKSSFPDTFVLLSKKVFTSIYIIDLTLINCAFSGNLPLTVLLHSFLRFVFHWSWTLRQSTKSLLWVSHFSLGSLVNTWGRHVHTLLFIFLKNKIIEWIW